MSSTPEPLGVSPCVATLSIVVSNSSTTDVLISCLWITVKYMSGPDGQDLTNDAGMITATVSAPGWQVATSAGEVLFTAPDNTDYQIGADGVLLQLTGVAVNDQVGTSTITISEFAHVGGDQDATRQNTYTIGKFPYGWTMSDFVAQPPLVEYLGSAHLSWQASPEGSYMLYYGTNAIDVSDAPTYESEQLTADTTFVLRGLPPGGTDYQYLTTTVTVATPDVVANSLQVTGDAQLTTIEATGAIHTTGELTASSATLTGQLQAATATVQGEIDAASVVATSDVTAAGLISKGSLTVDGVAQFNGPLIASYGMTVFDEPSQVDPNTTLNAASDGFVVGTVYEPNDAPAQGFGVINVVADQIKVTAVWTGNGTQSVPGNLVVPIGAGTECMLNHWDVIGTSTAQFWWIPLGGAQVGAGNDVATPHAADAVGLPLRTSGPSGDDIADVLEELTGQHLSPSQRARLSGRKP